MENSNTSRKMSRRIVLVGGTGEGKSATGNSILDENVFKVSCSGSSVTLTCSSKNAMIFDRDIQVVDTPGLFDTRRDNKFTHLEIIKCIQMTCPGPHCFLLVVAPGRFTKIHRECVESLFQYFGNDVYRFFIIVFTRKDELDNNGLTLDDYITTLPSDFKAVIEKCKYRYISLNNNAPDVERRSQVRALLDMVDRIVLKNHGHYTNEMYLKAEEEMRLREEKIRKDCERKKEDELKEHGRKMREDFERKKENELKEQARKMREEFEREKEKEINEHKRMMAESNRRETETSEIKRQNELLKMMIFQQSFSNTVGTVAAVGGLVMDYARSSKNDARSSKNDK